MRATEAAAGAGDDGDFSVEPELFAHRVTFARASSVAWPAFASTVGNSAFQSSISSSMPAVVAVEDGRHRGADHQLQREVERALEAGVLGDVLAEQRARLRDDADRAATRSAAASTGRSSGSVRAAVRSSIATWKNVPEKHCQSRSSTASVRARPSSGSCAGELLELARAHLGEVVDRGDQQLGLRREVMEQGAARDVGAALHLERRGAREADLDQALDRGVEQRAARLVAALLLRTRCAGSLGHPRAVYRPRNSQSRLFVCWLRRARGVYIARPQMADAYPPGLTVEVLAP